MKITPPTKRPYFKRIPRCLIYDFIRFNDYRVLFYLLLQQHMMSNSWEDNCVIFMDYSRTLSHINICPDRHKNANLEHFRHFVEELIQSNDLILDESTTIKQPTLYVNKASDFFYPHEQFAILYDFEINYILNQSKDTLPNGVQRWKLLLVLAYLRLNINVRYGTAYNTKQNRQEYPETYHQYFRNIADDLNLHKTAISKCIDALTEMGIIAYKHTKIFTNYNKTIAGRTIFANQYKYDLQQKGYLDSSYDFKKEIKECEMKLQGKDNKGLSTDTEDDMELPFD